MVCYLCRGKLSKLLYNSGAPDRFRKSLRYIGYKKQVHPVLRPYQLECVEASLWNFNNGIRSQVVSLPVGSGKTVIFSELVRRIKNSKFAKKKTLVVAHREELIDQARNHLQRANPQLVVDTEKAEKVAASNANIIVASVQTLGKAKSGRLEKFKKDDIDCIIIDEAHHSVSSIYLRILAHFGALPKRILHSDHVEERHSLNPRNDRSDVLVWGCSATIYRHDGVALGTVFDKISFQRTLLDMWKEKWLCGLKPIQIRTQVDISAVPTDQSDFVTSQLSFVINTRERNMAIVQCWKDYIRSDPRRSTLVFCADVQHMKHLTETFNASGIDAECVHGKTHTVKRAETVQKFKDGKIPVLVNCGVFTEGTDIPNIDCIILARPTQSAVLFQQMLGRGLRIHPKKYDCAVLDCVDGFSVNDVITIPTLLGLPAKFDTKGESIFPLIEKLAEISTDESDLQLITSIEDALDVISEGSFHKLQEKREINRILEKRKRLDGWSCVLHAVDWKKINSRHHGASIGPLGYLILKEEVNMQTGVHFKVFFVPKTIKQYGISDDEHQIFAKNKKEAEQMAGDSFLAVLNKLELPPPPPVVVRAGGKPVDAGEASIAQIALLKRLTGGRVTSGTKLSKVGASATIDKLLMQKALYLFLRRKEYPVKVSSLPKFGEQVHR